MNSALRWWCYSEQNFLRYDGTGPIPAQIVGWMKKSNELRELVNHVIATGGRARGRWHRYQ